MKEPRPNIRYLGFETEPDGGRRLEYSITSPERTARRAVVAIPREAFTGTHRLSFQDAAIVGSEKVRTEVDRELEPGRGNLNLMLTPDDIGRLRPRRRAAAKST